jgi:hypothetical protein
MVMTEAVGRLVADGRARSDKGGRILWIVYISAYPSLEELSLFGNAMPILSELGIEMGAVPYWDLQVSHGAQMLAEVFPSSSVGAVASLCKQG